MPNQIVPVGNDNGNALATRNAKKSLNHLFWRKSEPHLISVLTNRWQLSAVVGLNAPFPNDPDIEDLVFRTRYVHLGSDDGQNGIAIRESNHSLRFRHSLNPLAEPKLTEPQVVINRIQEFVNAFKRKREDERNRILAQVMSAVVLAGHEYGETCAAPILSQSFVLIIAIFKEKLFNLVNDAIYHVVLLKNYNHKFEKRIIKSIQGN